MTDLMKARRGPGNARPCVIGACALLSAVLLALCLPLAAPAWAEESAGTVELGISVEKRPASPVAGEEASVELGMTVRLDSSGAPANVPGSGEALIGIAIGYDRVVEEGYVLRLDACGGSVSPSKLVLKPDAKYEAGEAPEPPGFTFGDGIVPVPERAGYDFKGWYWGAPFEGDPALGYDADGRPTSLSYDEVRARAGETLYAKWEVTRCVPIELGGATAASGAGGVRIWYWPGCGYTAVDPAQDEDAAVAALAAAAGDALAVSCGQVPYPPYATQYFAGWAPSASAATADRVVACEKGEDGYAFSMLAGAFDDGFVQGLLASEADIVWYPVFETAQISVRAPFKVTFKARSDGGAHSVADLEELADDGDKATLDSIFSEAFTETDIEALLSGSDRFVLSPQAFTNTSASLCDVYISSVECANAGASTLLPGGNLNVEVFSLAERPSAKAPTALDQPSAIRFGYAGGVSKATVGRDEPDERKIVLRRPVESETGDMTYEPRILWYGLDLASSGFDVSKIAFSSSDDEGDKSYLATLANVKYTYSVAL